MTLYQTGENIRITATITDENGDAADPDTIVISIKKPDGTLDVTDAAMTKSATGVYYYDYLIASDTGFYYASVKTTGSSGLVTKMPDSFRVGDAI